MTTLDLSIGTATCAPVEERSERAVAWGPFIGLCLFSALLGRLIYLIKPFDNDAQVFIYMGKLVCDGGRFGHDILDNKFPTVGLMTSPFWRAFGMWWGGYVLTQTAMGIGGALLLARSAGRALGDSARLPVLLVALVYLNLSEAVYGGFQLETAQSFFAILAAGASLEALIGARAVDAFVVGLAAGCAAMWKPSGGAVLGAFAIVTIVAHRRNLPRLIAHGSAALVGLALPAIVTLVYLLRTDILRDMPDLYRQIARYAADSPFEWTDLWKPAIVLALVLFPTIVRARFCRRDDEDSEERPGRKIVLLFAILWLAMELAGVVAQRRMYAYYFLPVMAPAALLVGTFPRRDRSPALLLALMPGIILSLIGVQTDFQCRHEFAQRLPVSNYIASHTQPGDRVWQDIEPRLLLETDRLPGSRIPLTFLFFNYDTAGLDYARIILKDFEVRRPKYVILPMDVDAKVASDLRRSLEMSRRPVREANYTRGWHEIEKYVQKHYLPETHIGNQTIYRRR